MAVIHVFKDGTTSTSLENVYVPKEIVQQFMDIANMKVVKVENEKKKNPA